MDDSPPKSRRRWHHLTPARLFVGLLVVQVFLLLSERFQWFGFNEKKGWTVLIAIGLVFGAILVMLVWGLVCLFLRRQFQFSFRSMLVFLVVVSVPLGWFAWELQRARRQRKAVEAISELFGSGSVAYDFQLDKTGKIIIPVTQPTAPSWLGKWLGGDFFCDVKSVYLLQVTDAGLVYLKGMTNLEELYLVDTQVTNAGLEQLERLTSVRHLELKDTQVTDAWLEHLRGLTNLRYLYLDNTQVTDEGVENLQQALPDCEIRY